MANQRRSWRSWKRGFFHRAPSAMNETTRTIDAAQPNSHGGIGRAGPPARPGGPHRGGPTGGAGPVPPPPHTPPPPAPPPHTPPRPPPPPPPPERRPGRLCG